jgi:hypothetical protein
MSMRLCAALLFGSIVSLFVAAGCATNETKSLCNPDDCAPVKCPGGDRRACIDGECVKDTRICPTPT